MLRSRDREPPVMTSNGVVLIGGASHTGKSMLAIAMAKRLGWSHVSTDWLARHPGRPWATPERDAVPVGVAKHYLSLSVDELVADVMRHYDGMWERIEGLVRTHVSDPSSERLVLEGSAVLPERVAAAGLDGGTALWLTADGGLLESRIHASSGFRQGTAAEKELIQKFVARNRRYNELVMEAVDRLRLTSIDVGTVSSMDELTERCIGLVAR